MPAILQEWLNLLVRWIHVIAAIMWVGDSFLFMWLDRSLDPPKGQKESSVVGMLWMTHSGGFYEVVKRRALTAEQLPPTLHWFKWESYTTWISGFLLLVIVYHAGNGLLVDPAVSSISTWQAHALNLGVLPAAWLVYEALWRTPLAKVQWAFALVGLLLLMGLAYALTHLLSGRGAFITLGAVMGTVMASNVFFVIIPAQRHMLDATRAGTPVDTSYGLRAKGRSIQNHYLTLPVVFTMLSNHFPSTYSSPQAWLVLGLLFVFGAGLKHLMSYRTHAHPALMMGTVAAAAGVVGLTSPQGMPREELARYEKLPRVSFATVQAITQSRCVTCHSRHPSNPMFPAAPQGVFFDQPGDLEAHADRLFMRAVSTRTMPLGNLTGISEGERELLGAWVAQGADVHAPGGVALPVEGAVPSSGGTLGTAGGADGGPRAAAGVAMDGGAAADASTPLTPAQAARQRFDTLCATCHGPNGDGNGPASAALNPKPRNFHDEKFQAEATDAALATVILGGGPAVGKSPLMPPNPDLAARPEVVAELVKIVRGFRQK